MCAHVHILTHAEIFTQIGGRTDPPAGEFSSTVLRQHAPGCRPEQMGVVSVQ